MKIEILATTKDTQHGGEQPTELRITADNGEVVEISIQNDSTYYHQYTPYLDIEKSKA